MNYFERHLGDYARDAGHLSMLEHGAYTLLLDRYYTTEQGIPQDQAHRVCRARSKEERAAVDAVLTEFFLLKDGIWTNGRAEREVAKMQTKIEAARTNGKLGGRPKKNQAGTQEKPSGLSSGSQGSAQDAGIREKNVLAATQQKSYPQGTPKAKKVNEINGTSKPNGLSLGSDSETQEKAHQTPDTRIEREERGDRAPAPAFEVEGLEPTAAGLACRAMKAAGVLDVNPGHPGLIRLLSAGVTAQVLGEAAAECVAKGKARFVYVLSVVEGRLRDAATAGAVPAVSAKPWYDSRSGIEGKGEELGIGRWDQDAFEHGRGEPWPHYQRRVFDAAGHREVAA